MGYWENAEKEYLQDRAARNQTDIMEKVLIWCLCTLFAVMFIAQIFLYGQRVGSRQSQAYAEGFEACQEQF